MALIQCPECGKKFSDKAVACPECGCPTEYILNNLKTESPMENINDTQIINEYNILGKQFIIDEKLDNYLRYISSAEFKRVSCMEEINQAYYKCKDIDELITSLPEWLSLELEALVEESVDTLVEFGVYEFDNASFLEKYSEEIDFTGLISPLVEEYLKIQNYQDKINQYHAYVRQCRKNAWSGGGFSVKGAIEGQIKAELMNVGNVFLHSFSDSTNRIKDNNKILVAKAKLLKDSKTRELILNAAESICNACIDAVICELIHAGKFSNYVIDTNKAIGILNNLPRIQSGKVSNAVRDAFFLDPAFYPTIAYMLDKLRDVEIVRYARDYGFLETYLAEKREKLAIYGCRSINDIYDKSNIADNVTVTKILEVCIMMEKSEVPAISYIEEALNLRMEYPFKKKDFEEIKNYIENNKAGCLTDEFLQGLYEKMQKRIQMENSLVKYAQMVKEVCDGYKVDFWTDSHLLFSKTTDIKKISDYKKYEEAAEIPISAQVYALYGLCLEKKVKYVIAITDMGLYATDSWNYVRINWLDFSKQQIGKVPSGICIGKMEIHISMCDDIFRLLKAIFDKLNQTDKKKVISKSLESVMKIVEETCKEYANKKHWPAHRFNCQKTICEMENFINVQRAFKIPNEVEIYYLYATSIDNVCFMEGLAITNIGVYIANAGESIGWDKFLEEPISKTDKEKINIGAATVTIGAQRDFTYELLLEIKNRIIAVNKIDNGRNKAIDISTLLSRYESVVVYDSNTHDLWKLISETDPDLQKTIEIVKNKDSQGIGNPNVYIYIRLLNKAILITDRYIISRNDNAPLAIKISTLICVRMGKNKSSIPSLLMYSEVNEKSFQIFFVEVDESLLSVDLSAINDYLYSKKPFDSAFYFRTGNVVSKNYDKAIELYKMAIAKKENEASAYYFLGYLYKEKKDYIQAESNYLRAIDFKLDVAYYDLAIMYYETPDVKFVKDYHYQTLVYMDYLSQKKYKDARERLLIMLSDVDLLDKARKEHPIGDELNSIINRKGVSVSEVAAQKTQEVMADAMEKGKKIFSFLKDLKK